jgi:hypothetical protein
MKLFLARAERRGQGLSSGRPISGQRLLKICHNQPAPTNSVALKLKSLFAERAKANQGTRTDIPQNSAKSLEPVDTRAELAKLAHVSHDTPRFDFLSPLCHHFFPVGEQTSSVGAAARAAVHRQCGQRAPILFSKGQG